MNYYNVIVYYKVLTAQSSPKVVSKKASKKVSYQLFRTFYNVPIITEFLSDFHILKEYMGKHSWRTCWMVPTLVDIYTISRMLKTFKTNTTNGIADSPENIIYYAGNTHSILVREFLKLLGFS